MKRRWQWIGSGLGALAVLALAGSGCSSVKKESGKESVTESGKTPGNNTPPSERSEASQTDPLLAVGTAAPDFMAEAHDGTTVQLSQLKGQPVVLYFYPKDATPG